LLDRRVHISQLMKHDWTISQVAVLLQETCRKMRCESTTENDCV